MTFLAVDQSPSPGSCVCVSVTDCFAWAYMDLLVRNVSLLHYDELLSHTISTECQISKQK